jgi:hypothetical protein
MTDLQKAPPAGGVRTSLAFAMSGPMAGWASGTFGPGLPIQPAQQNPIRFVDYPVSVNTNIRPRAFAPIGFPELRAFANVELVRMAIETRKDQLERLEWQITPTDQKLRRKGASGIPTAAMERVTKFWRKPDGITPFASWVRLLMEDLLVLDAPTVARMRTRGGGLTGLEVIPGDTILPMVDETGRRPRQPGDIAYQQVIKGMVWNNLTNADIIYTPRNPRPNHLYGFSPVEQIIVTIQTIIRRQAAQLSWFTAGNRPDGLLNAPASWNPDQIKDMQAWLDAKTSGNEAERAKLLVVPEMKYQAFKDAPIKDDFDEWLARIVAYAFSLPPTPFIKQMNRSTGQTDADRSMEEGLEPLKLWVKRFADAVIQDDLGEPGLEFAWVNTPEIDPKAQSEIDDKNLRNGSTVIDEVRDARGQDPLPDGLGSKPLIYTGTGAQTIEQVLAAAEQALEPPEPQPATLKPGEQPAEPGAQPSAKPGPGGKPAAAKPGQGGKTKDDQPTEKLAKASKLITTDRPLARRATAAVRKTVTKVLAKAADEAAASVAKGLRALGKAADDGSIAARLAAAADLEAFDELVAAIFEDLFEVAADAGELALASIGATSTDALVDQVHQRAVAYAKARAAQLVSLQGDMNIVTATREQIREAIAAGLEENLGSAAIADAIQALPAFSAARAELIASSEIRMANAAGKTEAWEAARADQGVQLVKGWQTSNDDTCCDECSDNEAVGLIPFDEAFPSGAEDEGDSHPNCHCVTYVEVVETGGE